MKNLFKKRGCSLTDYSEKRTAYFLKKISKHPCKGDWRRWREIRIPCKQCLITWSFINTDNELLGKNLIIAGMFVINFEVFQSTFTTSDFQMCFSDC